MSNDEESTQGAETPTDERYCPLCQLRTDATICPTDRVPTVAVHHVRLWTPFPPGSTVAGRYRIERLLGEGGMGAVMLANQIGMNRQVAIKTLARHFASDPDGVARFYQEARAASQIEHPNVVRVFDFGVDEATGTPFLVMEYLRGEPLTAILHRERRLTERRACGMLAQVAKALIEAHDKGIVHRDLKPENVFVQRLADGEEFVKVLDFGIAKLASAGSRPRITRTGNAVGTPAYMSPEQIQGHDVDFTSDLYSLGCILHHLLAGREPFTAEDASGVFVGHLLKPAPPLPEALADGARPSPGLMELSRTLLAKTPAQRPKSTTEVARALYSLAGVAPQGTALFVQPPVARQRDAEEDAILASEATSDVLIAYPLDADDQVRLGLSTPKAALDERTGLAPTLDFRSPPSMPEPLGSSEPALPPTPPQTTSALAAGVLPKRSRAVWLVGVPVAVAVAASVIWATNRESPPAVSTASAPAPAPALLRADTPPVAPAPPAGRPVVAAPVVSFPRREPWEEAHAEPRTAAVEAVAVVRPPVAPIEPPAPGPPGSDAAALASKRPKPKRPDVPEAAPKPRPSTGPASPGIDLW